MPQIQRERKESWKNIKRRHTKSFCKFIQDGINLATSNWWKQGNTQYNEVNSQIHAETPSFRQNDHKHGPNE